MHVFGVLRLLLPLASAQSYSFPGYAYSFHLKALISQSSPLSYVEGWGMTTYRTELLPHVGRAVLYDHPVLYTPMAKILLTTTTQSANYLAVNRLSFTDYRRGISA
jgi:hypothetical protein